MARRPVSRIPVELRRPLVAIDRPRRLILPGTAARMTSAAQINVVGWTVTFDKPNLNLSTANQDSRVSPQPPSTDYCKQPL